MAAVVASGLASGYSGVNPQKQMMDRKKTGKAGRGSPVKKSAANDGAFGVVRPGGRTGGGGMLAAAQASGRRC